MSKKLFISLLVLLLAAITTTIIVFTVRNPKQEDDINSPEATPAPSVNVNNPPSHHGVDIEGYTLLARLAQPDPTVPADSPQLPDRSFFRANDGVFRNVSGLTAWDNNEQVLIGETDSATGVPIMFSGSSLTSGNWLSAQNVGLFNASGFRLTFSTEGYENIRFTAHQILSEDFGDEAGSDFPFEMAFSTSGGVRWTTVHDSGVNVSKSSSNTIEAITSPAACTYNNFSIPGVINNQEEVLLRIYLNTASNISGKGSMSINNILIIGDEIDTGATDVVLMELGEDFDNASAIFSATPEDAVYRATDGLLDSDFRLTGWDRGRPRFIGYTGEVQTPVVFENVMTTGGWTTASVDIDEATAFQIQLRTSGYEDIVFSAGQISSADGPNVFKLAYSKDGETWIAINDSTRNITESSGRNTDPVSLTYDRFPLPDEFSNNDSVFLRVYFDGTATGESTSINNIEFWGREIVSYAGFPAQMLSLQPGKTCSELNITWHEWKMIGTDGKVRFEPAATAANGFTQNANTVNAESTDSYIRMVSHMATIVGLEPDTEYVYAVSGDGEIYSELYSFRTSPVDTFTFVAISDVHMGDPSVSPFDDDSGNNGMLDEKYRPGVTVKQGWTDALDVIINTVSNVSLVTIMGDVVDRNLIDMESEPELHPHKVKWENYFTPSQVANIPFAPVMGNHEARSNIAFRVHFNLPNEIVPSADEMLTMASTGIQQENENMANYWYLYNNALFVVLNTSTRPRDANENAAQDAITQGVIAHFDYVLEAAKAAHEGEYDWLFVQTHKSISGMGKHSADFDVERYVRFGLEELVVKHGVDILFSAHEHGYTRSFPLVLNPGADNFGPEVPRSLFRMNNVRYDFEKDGETLSQGDGTVLFTLSSISGQKFYPTYAPEFFNNSNFPYLYDGTRGALNMSLSPAFNTFLSDDIETFGPRTPWSVVKYHQEYKPVFIEMTVTDSSVTATVYEFAHDIAGSLIDVNVIDSLTITK